MENLFVYLNDSQGAVELHLLFELVSSWNFVHTKWKNDIFSL